MNQALQKLAGELDGNGNRLPPAPNMNMPMKQKTKPTTEIEPPANLPDDRQRAVEYGLAQFQQVAHERDQLQREASSLRDRVATLEIENEGLRTQLNDTLSQKASAYLTRDQALADRMKYEALFVAVQSLLRAFAVPAAPLIKNADDH